MKKMLVRFILIATALLALSTTTAMADGGGFGQTLSPNMKRHVAMLIKQNCPDVKILELYSSHSGKMLDDADSALVVPADVPKELAERVVQLARKHKRKDAKPKNSRR